MVFLDCVAIMAIAIKSLCQVSAGLPNLMFFCVIFNLDLFLFFFAERGTQRVIFLPRSFLILVKLLAVYRLARCKYPQETATRDPKNSRSRFSAVNPEGNGSIRPLVKPGTDT